MNKVETNLLQPMFFIDADVDAVAATKAESVLAAGCDFDAICLAVMPPLRVLEVGSWLGMVAPAADCLWLVAGRFVFVDTDCRPKAQGGGKPDIVARIAAL